MMAILTGMRWFLIVLHFSNISNIEQKDGFWSARVLKWKLQYFLKDTLVLMGAGCGGRSRGNQFPSTQFLIITVLCNFLSYILNSSEATLMNLVFLH